jgi:hypothetical protein
MSIRSALQAVASLSDGSTDLAAPKAKHSRGWAPGGRDRSPSPPMRLYLCRKVNFRQTGFSATGLPRVEKFAETRLPLLYLPGKWVNKALCQLANCATIPSYEGTRKGCRTLACADPPCNRTRPVDVDMVFSFCGSSSATRRVGPLGQCCHMAYRSRSAGLRVRGPHLKFL